MKETKIETYHIGTTGRTVDVEKTTYYNEAGEIHREDGPAIVTSDGFEAWVINQKLHREDGPALTIKKEDGCLYEEWWINGELIKKAGD